MLNKVKNKVSATARSKLRYSMILATIEKDKLHFDYQEHEKFAYWCLNLIMRSESLYHAKVYMDNQNNNLQSVKDIHDKFKEDDQSVK